MKNAEKHEWCLVISGVERIDASQAFHGTRFSSTWFENTSPIDYDDPDAGIIVTIKLPDIETLKEALLCCHLMRPSWGIQLCLSADFGHANVSGSLCSNRGQFLKSSCSIVQSAASVQSEIEKRIQEASDALHSLRLLSAAKGGAT